MGELLFLAHRIPYPPDKGDKLRAWRELKRLAERTTVHLATFVDDPMDYAHVDTLRAICGEVIVRPLTRTSRPWRGFKGLAREQPLSLAFYDDPEMRGQINALLRRRPVDKLFVFSSQVAQYALPHASGRRLVIDFVDVDSEKWRKYAEEAEGAKQWLYAREAKLLLAADKAAARAADASILVSEPEAALFRKLAGSWAHDFHVIQNGVDRDYFDPEGDFAPLPAGARPLVVFTGAMDYRPNIDAALWFARDVWPAIRAAHPAARFAIVGSKPSAEVKALGGADGIEVTGRVDDIRPWIAAADVAVAPLRIARGIQNKVLEAMAMAKAVVASPPAFEGIEATAGEHLIVAEGADAQAKAVLALLADPAERARIGAAALALVTARYDWGINLSLLDRLFELGSE